MASNAFSGILGISALIAVGLCVSQGSFPNVNAEMMDPNGQVKVVYVDKIVEKVVEKIVEKPVIVSGQKIPSKEIQIQKINKQLDGALKGKGETFVSYGYKYNVNPYLLAAISIHETGNGTSKAIKDRNNAGGLMGNKGLMYFKTIDSSIEYMAQLLKTDYIDQGLTDIDSIQKKYCPVGATNDPTNLNIHWLPTVSSLYEKIRAN